MTGPIRRPPNSALVSRPSCVPGRQWIPRATMYFRAAGKNAPYAEAFTGPGGEEVPELGPDGEPDERSRPMPGRRARAGTGRGHGRPGRRGARPDTTAERNEEPEIRPSAEVDNPNGPGSRPAAGRSVPTPAPMATAAARIGSWVAPEPGAREGGRPETSAPCSHPPRAVRPSIAVRNLAYSAAPCLELPPARRIADRSYHRSFMSNSPVAPSGWRKAGWA